MYREYEIVRVIMGTLKLLGLLLLMVAFMDSVTYKSQAESELTYSEWKQERELLKEELGISRSPAIVD
jgi:hypothetical protein